MNQCIYKPNTTEYITLVNTRYTPQTREHHTTPTKSLQPNQYSTAQSQAKPNAKQHKISTKQSKTRITNSTALKAYQRNSSASYWS
jgi:hypothetical protein